MVKLRYRQVFGLPPFAAPVVRVPHPAIVSGEYNLWVRRVDPNIVRVAVRALKTAHDRKALAGVLAHNQRAVGLEQAVRIIGINDEVREIERSPDHPLAFITFLPSRAAVIGNEQRALRRLDKRIDALRFRWSDCYRQAAIRFLWETFVGLLCNLRPSITTIGRTE